MAWPKLLGSRQASCGLSVACPKPASSLLMGFRRQREAFSTGFKSLSAAGRPLAASLWPVRSFSAAGRPLAASLWPVRSLPPLFLWASEGNVRHFGSASNAPQSLTAALPSSRQLAGLPLLFLWASEGNVRHFGSASNAPRSLTAALPSSRQLAGLPLPKATLGILARLQTLHRASPQPCPLLGSWQACLFSSYGLPKATLGILPRLQTLPMSLTAALPLWACLLFWASESDVRHFGLSAAGRPLAASLWPVRSLPPLFLWASEGNVRHFGPASKASRQPAGLLRPLCGLSEACLLSSYGLPKATLGILARLQTLPRASPQPCPLLGSWLNASIGVKPIQVSLLNPRKLWILARFNRQGSTAKPSR